MSFSNKVVLIVGASSGIGAVTARKFAKKCAIIVLVGRNENRLNSIAKQCEEQHRNKVLIIIGDISIDIDVDRIINETVTTFGRIDILINCAGISKIGGIFDGINIYDEVMATNLRGVYLLTSKAVPHIIKCKGNIVNISSALAQKCSQKINMLAYSMSKAAINQFTKCLALELSKTGVRVNAVSPGATKTPFFEVMGFKKGEVEHLLDNIPTALGKVAESEEVAELILFLSSDKARSITGVIYLVDNGELLI